MDYHTFSILQIEATRLKDDLPKVIQSTETGLCLLKDKGYCIFLETGSYLDNITVQAPQPPTPQPYLIPVRRTAEASVKEKYHQFFR